MSEEATSERDAQDLPQDRDGQEADDDNQEQAVDYQAEYEKSQAELRKLRGQTARQSKKLGSIETQLNELLGKTQKGEPIDEEELEKAPKALRELLKRKDEELADWKSKFESEVKQSRAKDVKQKLRSVASGVIDPDLVDDAIELHSNKFSLEDGEILTQDGLTPDEFFAALVTKKPKWAKPKPSNGDAGVTGKSTKQNGSKTMSRATFSQLSPHEQMKAAREYTITD